MSTSTPLFSPLTDELAILPPPRPVYEDEQYVLAVCPPDERGLELAVLGFRARGFDDDDGKRIVIREARIVSLQNDDFNRDAVRRVRKAIAGRPIDNEHHNGYGTSDLYVEGNRIVLEPAMPEMTLYRPSYVLGVPSAVAERLRPPEMRKPVPAHVPDPGGVT